MSEAMISRAPGKSEPILPVVPGYHMILATLKDGDGKPVEGLYLNCTDGSSQYNYKTNEKGQVLFSCNSGSGNIYFNNNQNGVIYADMESVWMNMSAPIGLSSRCNVITNRPEYTEFLENKIFTVSKNRNVNLCIIGGGGGGAIGYWSTGDNVKGGGAGYMNTYDIILEKNNIYNFIVGIGGNGTYFNSFGTYNEGYNCEAGGTSYIVNSDYSAMGGSSGAGGGAGGLGSGAGGRSKGGDSPINFAGGGGGGIYEYTSNHVVVYSSGGAPYGAKGGNSSSSSWYNNSKWYILAYGNNATRAGGGGAQHAGYWNSSRGESRWMVTSGRGGDGLVRIIFK